MVVQDRRLWERNRKDFILAQNPNHTVVDVNTLVRSTVLLGVEPGKVFY